MVHVCASNVADLIRLIKMTDNTQPETEIDIMRNVLEAHKKEAIYQIEHGMFYSARLEMDACIMMSCKIGKKLIREV